MEDRRTKWRGTMMDGLGVSVVAGQFVRRVGWNGEAAMGVCVCVGGGGGGRGGGEWWAIQQKTTSQRMKNRLYTNDNKPVLRKWLWREVRGRNVSVQTGG